MSQSAGWSSFFGFTSFVFPAMHVLVVNQRLGLDNFGVTCAQSNCTEPTTRATAEPNFIKQESTFKGDV